MQQHVTVALAAGEGGKPELTVSIGPGTDREAALRLLTQGLQVVLSRQPEPPKPKLVLPTPRQVAGVGQAG